MADQKDDQDHVQHEDGLQALGEEANVWQEEHPPVDGFADQEMDEHANELDGEAGVESEELEDDSDAEVDEDEETQPRKKAMWVPVVAAAVGLVFVGSMMYLQFSGGPSNAPTPMPISEVLGQPDLQSSAPPQSAAGDTATTNSNFSAAASVASDFSQPTIPAAGNAVPSVPSGSVTEPLTTTASLPQDIPPAPPVAALPSPVAPPSVAPVASQPVVPPAHQASAPLQPPVMGKSGQKPMEAMGSDKTPELMARIDTLQKALDQTTQQLTQMSAAVANLQAAGSQAIPASGSVSPEVMDRLAKLEQKLAAKKEMVEKPVVEKPVADAVTSSFADEPAVAEAPVKKAEKTDTSKKAKAEKKVAHRKESHKHKVASREAEEPSVRHKSSWVLRAATPDTAWVSKSADSAELQQVEVGQALSGIGKVTAIRANGSGWEIIGTSGSLK